MPTLDYDVIKKLVTDAGLVIGHSTKHHTLETKEGVILERFAVLHTKGSKKQVLAPYVKKIKAAIAEYTTSPEAKENNEQ